MRYRNLIGPTIRRLRYQKGWTQEELAGALQRAGWDISRSGVAKLEARVSWVKDFQLHYLRKVLRIELEDLFPPIDPEDREMYSHVERLMNSRY